MSINEFSELAIIPIGQQSIEVNENLEIHSHLGIFTLPFEATEESLAICGEYVQNISPVFILRAPLDASQIVSHMKLYNLQYNTLNLNSFRNIVELDIINSAFINISPVFTIPTLRSLLVEDSPIEHINLPIDSQVGNLKSLTIRHSAIATVPNFNLFPALIDLTFNSNAVLNFNDIAPNCRNLFGMPNFDNLSLSLRTNQGEIFIEIYPQIYTNTPRTEESLRSILEENLIN